MYITLTIIVVLILLLLSYFTVLFLSLIGLYLLSPTPVLVSQLLSASLFLHEFLNPHSLR
jgi:hypothetical protein